LKPKLRRDARRSRQQSAWIIFDGDHGSRECQSTLKSEAGFAFRLFRVRQNGNRAKLCGAAAKRLASSSRRRKTGNYFNV